ncbi:SDR family NAD(P)-dependent oxidoreductase [Pontibacter actiniarum]|uniref:Ketoacyl reductase n=1 Tax=Pontibacter actiniarum TaxID=323450 RepID=A0A1X9YRQ5_9BACT|nr:SDR family oxidoreductase [Pontibacter actiniarum]ARS35557.1 ketoacyl reductase [Pontibacter actiniarum]
MDLKIAGRVAVVTGADSGMGLATAKVLAAEGAKVILTDKTDAELQAAADQVRQQAQSAADVVAIQADLTRTEDVQALAEQVKETFGGAHILAHYAGERGAAGDFLKLTDEDWLDTLNVDLLGAVRVCRAFIPQMQELGWGRVVLVSSENAMQPYEEESPYNAAKAAIVNLAKCLSRAYAHDGLLINCVSPAFIKTPMTDTMMEQKAKERGTSVDETVQWFLENKRPHIKVNRRGRAEEVAAVVAFLCSEQASFVNGSNYRIDGGSVETAFG